MSSSFLEAPVVLTVIPARYASTRFPGKPLAMLHGRPMLEHTWRQVQASHPSGPVVVATDDERIVDAVEAFGGVAQLTDPNHPSGTDRVWEVAHDYPEVDWVLNVQGDEPLIDPQHLTAIIQATATWPEADILTLVCPIPAQQRAQHLADPNLVKAVRAQSGQCLYFSRAAVPFARDGWEDDGAWNKDAKTEPTPACALPETHGSSEAPDVLPVYRHLGLYLYRRAVLEKLTRLSPSPLEQLEKLEQLRALEAGYRIYARVVDNAPIGVDTPEDLARLQALPWPPVVVAAGAVAP